MQHEKNLERYILIGLAVVSLYFVISVLIGCASLPFEGNVEILLDGDDESPDCRSACQNLERLGCDESRGSPGPDDIFGTEDDISCFVVCRELTREKTFTLNQKCISEIDSCLEVDSCFE